MSGDESKKDVYQVENGALHQQQNGGHMEKVHVQSVPGDLKQIVLEGLEKKGDRGLWLWVLFILCLTPNILNGFHVSSYVFLGQMPENYYCVVPSLVQRGWTHDEIRNISTIAGSAKNGTCSLLNWDYHALEGMNYQEAQEYLKDKPLPGEVSCLRTDGLEMYYHQSEGASIVPEWDLICERTAHYGLSGGQ